MSFGLLNLVMVFGLFAVVIPIIIHLLNRQRYQVVDWGAMQFLQISTTRRRKLFFEELLLLLLRMGLIAVLVLALAAPFATGSLVNQFASRPNRDVVLIIDGSASMALDDGKNVTPHEAAKVWARRFLAELSPGDTVALVMARAQPVPLVSPLTRDARHIADAIAGLPAPGGGCDGPRSVAWALDQLRLHGQHAEQDIIILTDGLRPGWFDDTSLSQWRNLTKSLAPDPGRSTSAPPRLWMISVLDPPEASPSYPSCFPGPLTANYSHVWSNKEVTFQTNLHLKGPLPYGAPHRLKLLIDNKPARNLDVPVEYPWSSGQVPISFRHSFTAPGSHLLSVIVEPDPPASNRSLEHALRDYLIADNRSDLAVMVRDRLQVLMVDGNAEITSESSTSALAKAFANKTDDGHPSAVVATAIPYPKFTPALLNGENRPRVLLLADVPHLDANQRRAVEQYLADGGAVLIAVAERVTDPSFYNLELHQGGQGWLPARLDKVLGQRDQPDRAAAMDLADLRPPLTLFRDKAKNNLGQARFPLWWKLAVPAKSGAAVLATLHSGDPFLIEKPYKKGRVLLCSVPLDHAWGSNFPSIWEYSVLVHELVYWLADSKSTEFNVRPGQPLRWTPPQNNSGTTAPLPLTIDVKRPDHRRDALTVSQWPAVYERTEEPGIYEFNFSDGQRVFYVVDSDRLESELLCASDADRQLLAAAVQIRYASEPGQVGVAILGADHREDIWWCLMLAVIALLCLEIWMTRRMVAKRDEGPS